MHTLDYDTRVNEAGVQLDGTRDFAMHAKRRQPWTKATSVAALKGYETVVLTKVNELVEAFETHSGEVIDLSEWMMYYGLDFMGQLACVVCSSM